MTWIHGAVGTPAELRHARAFQARLWSGESPAKAARWLVAARGSVYEAIMAAGLATGAARGELETWAQRWGESAATDPEAFDRWFRTDLRAKGACAICRVPVLRRAWWGLHLPDAEVPPPGAVFVWDERVAAEREGLPEPVRPDLHGALMANADDELELLHAANERQCRNGHALGRLDPSDRRLLALDAGRVIREVERRRR